MTWIVSVAQGLKFIHLIHRDARLLLAISTDENNNIPLVQRPYTFLWWAVGEFGSGTLDPGLGRSIATRSSLEVGIPWVVWRIIRELYRALGPPTVQKKYDRLSDQRY